MGTGAKLERALDFCIFFFFLALHGFLYVAWVTEGGFDGGWRLGLQGEGSVQRGGTDIWLPRLQGVVGEEIGSVGGLCMQ